MAQHFFMGAMNKTTNTYEYPTIADKKNKYECPECKKDVIFKKGTIIRPYFAHKKSNSPCYYYDKPNEAQIHKDAKLLLKSLLDNKKILYFYRSCPYCYNDKEIFYLNYHNENMKAVIEHPFIYNESKKRADVALLENNEIKFIFEICYKNKTKEENRPEPWVEINAEDLINGMNTGEIVDEDGREQSITQSFLDWTRSLKSSDFELVSKDECCIEHNMLVKYNVISLKGTTNDVKPG
jgi:hypothetical protein